MNIRKITKIVTVLAFIATIALAFSTVFANTVIPTPNTSNVDASIKTPTESVLNIIAYVCYVAAVILLIMLGIKYMTQAPEGKAEIKKMAVTYVVGAVLVFAAGAVLQIISNVANNSLK